MSLVARLQSMFAVLTLVCLGLGLALVIHHARTSVHAELASTVNLTSELLRGAVGPSATNNTAWNTDALIDRLDAVTLQRHIRLEKLRDGEERPLSAASSATAETAPAWFTWLVRSDPETYTRSVPLHDAADTTLIVRAEPADEVSEAWRGARGLLALLAGFGVAAVLLVQWGLHRALGPLQRLLAGMAELERGRYGTRLPDNGVPELDRVARQFNDLSAALGSERVHNQTLNRQLMAVQENERRHLARELHDELGQCMSALQAEAVAIRNDDAPLPDRTRDGAEAIRATARHVHDLARDLIHRLHPAELDELGLQTALHSMATDWASRHPDSTCVLELDPALARHPTPERDIHIYRVAQEALTNVSRHAHASRVRVRLKVRGACLRLTVADNGRGFGAHTRVTGFGLTGMRERATSLGGEIALRTGLGRGTCLSLRLPLRPSGADPSADADTPDAAPDTRPSRSTQPGDTGILPRDHGPLKNAP